MALSASAQRFAEFGRNNAQFATSVLAVLGVGGGLTILIKGLTDDLGKERELRQEAVLKERELRQEAVRAAVLEAEAKMAQRLIDLTFAEEYKEWRRDTLNKRFRGG